VPLLPTYRSLCNGRVAPRAWTCSADVRGACGDGNVTDVAAQVVGGVFARRGQRASVTVLECSRWLGGTTAFPVAASGLPADCWGRAEGIADSTDEGLRYLTALGRGDLNRTAAGVVLPPDSPRAEGASKARAQSAGT